MKNAAPVVLISGGSKGLGLHLVRDLIERGQRVATFSRSLSPGLEALVAQDPDRTRLLHASIDGNDVEAARKFVLQTAQHFGRIDALVNNAAALTEQLLTLTRPSEIDQMLSMNLRLPVYLTQACARVMLTQGSGSIVNISSLNGVRGHSGVAVYSATKAGLDGMTRSLARELGPKGIRVNTIAPGYFESDGASQFITEKAKERIAKRTPLRRLGTTEDVVGAVHFLLSPAASFITGQTIMVDGGITV